MTSEKLQLSGGHLRVPRQTEPVERTLCSSGLTEGADGVDPQQLLIHCSPFTGCRITAAS